MNDDVKFALVYIAGWMVIFAFVLVVGLVLALERGTPYLGAYLAGLALVGSILTELRRIYKEVK